MKRPVLSLEEYFNKDVNCQMFDITQSVSNVSSATIMLTDTEARRVYYWLKALLNE